MKHIYIIAEIGCNHCGDPKLAKKMVDEAKACGVDAVKFQTFKAAELISKYAPKADYQKVTTGNDENQLEMTRKLELPYDEFIKLRDYAVSLGLDTFSTPFDMDSIAFLEQQKQAIWKIPSGEVTNLPFLERIAKYKIPNKKIILSTGMCTIEEIHQAVDIICKYEDPKNLIILHCNTEYPTPDKDVNLSAIDTLHQEFPAIEIGFSDHSVGYVAAIGACMRFACSASFTFRLAIQAMAVPMPPGRIAHCSMFSMMSVIAFQTFLNLINYQLLLKKSTLA